MMKFAIYKIINYKNMEMQNMEAGFGSQLEKGPIKVEGRTDEEILNQLLEDFPEQKREGLREVIEENLAQGDREIPVLLIRMHNLMLERKKLYQQYETAPADQKVEFSKKLLAKWDEIEKVAGAIDTKIASTLLKDIVETWKVREVQ